MEPSRFDNLTRAWALLASRRGLFKGSLALAAGSFLHLGGRRWLAAPPRPAVALASSAPGVIPCDGMLVNSNRDSDYCGDCDTRCPGTHHCVDGHCQPDVRTASADDGCNSRYLKLWFSGFIPHEIPNVTLASPLRDGATIARPFFSSADYIEGDRCFITNGRTFSPDSRQPSLFHSAIEIDLIDLSIVNQDHRADPLELVDCGTGELLCRQQVSPSALSFSTPWASPEDKTFAIAWNVNAPLPCIDGGPELAFDLQLNVQRALAAGAVRVQAAGTRQAFPALEIYASLEGGVPVKVLQGGADVGSAFAELYLEPPCPLDQLDQHLLCGCGQCEPGRSCQVEDGLQVCDDLRSFHLLSASPNPADTSGAEAIVVNGLLDVLVHEAPVFTNSSNGSDPNVPVRTIGLIAAEGDLLRLSLRNMGVPASFDSSIWLHRLIDGRSRQLYDPASPLPPEETLEIAQPIAFGSVRDWAGAVACCELPEVTPQVCADAWNDRVHCGSCGHACNSDQYCATGRCHCLPPKSACDDECVDLMVDPFHCGACGVVCGEGNGRCNAGVCEA